MLGFVDDNEAEGQFLIDRLRSNDKVAISLLYDKYAPALYGVIFRIVRSHPKAEAVLEKTFLKCLEDLHVSSGQASLFTCMFRTARAFAIEENSSERASQEEYQAVFNRPKLAEEDYSQLVDGLDVQCSEIVKSLYINGYSLIQTAQALDITLDQVKTQLHVAITHISARMKHNPIVIGLTSLVSMSVQYNRL